ncbi:H-2 class II histocompatibility antigen, E-U alpha chain-like [Rhinoraja longicauda]
MESPYFEEDLFETLHTEINHFQALGNVLLCGDLNARTGCEPDFIDPQGNNYVFSQTEQGLQQQLALLDDYCQNWALAGLLMELAAVKTRGLVLGPTQRDQPFLSLHYWLCPVTLVNLFSPCLPTVPPQAAMYAEDPVEWGQPNTLICLADGFYPARINMKWKRNDEPVTEGINTTEYYLKNDYSFQRFTYLTFTPSPGDMYSCHVEHEGLERPTTVFWEPEVPEEASGPGTVICALGLTLGIISAVVGIILLIKERQRLQAQQQGI